MEGCFTGTGTGEERKVALREDRTLQTPYVVILNF